MTLQIERSRDTKKVWDTKETPSPRLQSPTFTARRKFNAELHLFEKKKGEKYDAILGRCIMTKLGIVLHYKKECFASGGIEIPMLPMGYWSPSAIKKLKNTRGNYIIVKDTE